MHFSAIDVETANPDIGSICQIGIARFAGEKLVDEWSTLVDPEDYFHPMNVSIHGIDARMVRGKPRLPDIADNVRRRLEGTVTVCHTHFDRVAISSAFDKYDLIQVSTAWLDSARVARRCWRDFAWRGYGLANVCKQIGYKFRHHDALEDAKAAGHILLAAMRESQLDIDAWMHRIDQPIDPESSSVGAAIRRDGTPEGDLYGEIVVFTGALDIPRHEAADLAASIGCQVAQNVTKKTTILVVGDQDVSKLAGHEKSIKHRKAEELSAAGRPIRIIRETDFRALVQSAQTGMGEPRRVPSH